MDKICLSNVFANISGWFAFALLVNCTVTSYWIYVDKQHVGLFLFCDSMGMCHSIDFDWLSASRAFIIIGAILTLVSNIVSIVGFAKRLRKVQFAGAGIGLAASVCALIGTAIFTAKSTQREFVGDGRSYSFGYSLVIAWMVVVLLMISSVLNFTSAKLRKA